MCNTILCIPKPKRIYQVTCLSFSNQAQTFVHAEAMLSSEVVDSKEYQYLWFQIVYIYCS